MYGEERDALVRCIHCNQWAAVYHQCGHCGAPVMPNSPDDNESPMIACNHCQQFGSSHKECSHCGAPMPEKIKFVGGSYWMDGGASLRDDDEFFSSVWA